jgi:iron complex outermembrane receptor protein
MMWRMGESMRWSVCLVGAVVLTGPTLAQEKEILVTARKVEESLKDVPLAITALGSAELESAGIDSLADVASFSPGLQFVNPLGESLPVPIIRGVAPTDIRDSENNAAIFLDGVYVSGREGLNFGQLDLERVEVVKGPQSALYGRNAFSGAINFVSKRPINEYEATAEATVGNDGKLLGKGVINLPLIDGVLAARVAGLVDTWDGSYDNPLGGVGVGGYTYRTAKVGLLFTPNDSFDAYLNAYFSRDDIDDSATTALPTNCEDTALFNPQLQDDDGNPVGVNEGNFCGEVPQYNSTDIPKLPQATGEERDLFRVIFEMNWNAEFGTFTSLTGWDDTDQVGAFDFSRDLGYNTPFVYCTGLGLENPDSCQTIEPLRRFFGGVLNSKIGNETQEFSQEFRFTSPQDRAFRWSVGTYYFDFDREESNGDPQIIAPPGFSFPDDLEVVAPGFTHFCPCLQLGPGAILAPFGDAVFLGTLNPVEPTVEKLIEERAWSIFGAIEADFLESFRGRLELRYTDDEKEQQQFYTLNGAAASQTFDDGWNWVTGRISVDWRVNDDWLFYTAVATSEKSGGFDSDAVDVARDRNNDGDITDDEDVQDEVVSTTYEPEKILSKEIGVKGRTSDGRIGLDISMYHQNWEEIVIPQVQTSTADGAPIRGTIPSLNENTGDATVQGFEIAGDIRITDVWSANAAVGYVDSTFDNATQGSFAFFPSFQPSGDVSGNKSQRVSPWQASGSLRYAQPVASDWTINGRVDVIWQDEWYIGNDNQGVIPDHTYVNLRLGLSSPRWTVEAFVDNLFENDEPISAFRDIYWTNTQDIFAENEPPTSTLADFVLLRLSIAQPRLRTFGITGRMRFGQAVR